MIIEVFENNGHFSWDEFTELLHEAFQERLEQGLHFTCSFMTAEDLRLQLENSTVLVAVDCDNKDVLVGMEAIDVNDDEKGKWAYMSNLAVTPKYKRCGIMTRLFQNLEYIAKLNGCEYIESDTAVGAESSVKWHLKNGFKIVKLESFSSTNYYSYIFRKQLTRNQLWNSSLYCRFRFLLSAMKCRLRFHADGKNTKLMNMYLKLRKAI